MCIIPKGTPYYSGAQLYEDGYASARIKIIKEVTYWEAWKYLVGLKKIKIDK
jgi:hypothetical protein